MKNFLAYFFSILILLPTVMSCTFDNNEPLEEEIQILDKEHYRAQASSIIESIAIVNEGISNRRDPFPDPLDQATVDYYADMLGYAPGSVTVADVNNVMAQHGIATEEGLAAFLDQQAISQLAKLTLEQIGQGDWIEDLNTIDGFSELDVNEKEIIQLANAFVEQSQNNPESCGVGAFFGIIIGSFICQPVCVIIGAIIGCIGGK